MHYKTIGIFAHIDSGKTTLTEQILFQAGVIATTGTIEDGTTESDSLKEEIERGISIRTSFHLLPWKTNFGDYRLQIIDTPGHIDFRNQITDLLPCIEIGVVILEAGTVVQSQARLIIEELRKHRIPIVFFINKLDKGYEYLDCLITLEEILGVQPIVLFQQKEGLENLQFYLDSSDSFPLSTKEDLIKWSDELLLSYWDDSDKNSKIDLIGLAEGTIGGSLFPVYGGSAKTGAGVSALLDLICLIQGKPEKVSSPSEQFVLARRFEPDIGRYSVIYTKNEIYFPFKSQSESGEVDYQIDEAFVILNGEFVSIEAAHSSMLYFVKNDPSIECNPGSCIMSLTELAGNDHLPAMLASPFLINLEAEVSSDKSFWLGRLDHLVWEDPGYVFREIPETGQLQISGRGELHLEIGVKRLMENTHKKLHLSTINIARFEQLKTMAHKVALEHRAFGDSKASGMLTAVLEDTADFSKQVAFEVSLPDEVKNSIETAFLEATSNGFFGCEVMGIRMRVLMFSFPCDGIEFSPSLLKVSVHKGLKEGFQGNTRLVGPLTEFEILVDVSHVGVVISELNRRSAKIHSVDEERAGKSRLKATASAENMLGFSGALRNMTRGIGISWERTAFSPASYAVLKE